MHIAIREQADVVAALCREYGIARLELFGSAARGSDFDPVRSDADFLVSFEQGRESDFVAFADFKDAMEKLLGRSVDLVDRKAIEGSRNFIRRRRILEEAQPLYG